MDVSPGFQISSTLFSRLTSSSNSNYKTRTNSQKAVVRCSPGHSLVPSSGVRSMREPNFEESPHSLHDGIQGLAKCRAALTQTLDFLRP
ncbi:hypothetical protein Pla100_46840 [Neorhodopirellula pilleata]|uniref:Uncharacterized protein n=1 Tax=Neorhodopirellula pilleata TaxID=2714738 RepID=A0A5C5ZYS1_9BACT|nr:hypothetical protein Pla100_46840 [Neorhodopirellula pilleata]